MEKIEEKGMVFKTSRKSYPQNYFIVGLILIAFYLAIPYIDFRNPLMISLILLVFGIPISLMIEEPTIERFIRKYIVTEHGIAKIDGFLKKNVTTIPYHNISDVTLLKGFFGRILDYGDIEISGFKDKIVLKGMTNPEHVYNMLKRRISSREARVEHLEKP